MFFQTKLLTLQTKTHQVTVSPLKKDDIILQSDTASDKRVIFKIPVLIILGWVVIGDREKEVQRLTVAKHFPIRERQKDRIGTKSIRYSFAETAGSNEGSAERTVDLEWAIAKETCGKEMTSFFQSVVFYLKPESRRRPFSRLIFVLE